MGALREVSERSSKSSQIRSCGVQALVVPGPGRREEAWGGVRPGPALCRSCVGPVRLGSIGDRGRNTHKHSTTRLTTSMFATEKPRPLAKIEASSLGLWCRGKEAWNIFGAFKTLFCTFLQSRGVGGMPQGLKKYQLLILQMSGKNLTCREHFLSVSRN